MIRDVAATPPTQWAGGRVTISANVTDDVAIAAVAANVTLPDGTHANQTMAKGAGDEYAHASTWTQTGTHAFIVWAEDIVGKWASASGSFAIQADTTAPTISPTGPGSVYVGDPIAINATVTDPDDSVLDVRLVYTPVGGTEVGTSPHPGAGEKDGNLYRMGIAYHLGSIYFLFGYTYVIYATFIVTTLVKERGYSEGVAGNFWMWVGFLSLFSGPVFGTLSDRLSRKAGVMIVFSLQAVSYLLIATRLPGLFLYLSIGFYGLVAWSIPSIMAAAVGDYFGARRAATAFGFVTFIFGLGQISGPAVAGVLAEKTGSFSGSFYMAAVFSGIAILLTALLRKPKRT